MALLTNVLPIQIYAHRGARALAPENSLPAYKKALAIGVDYVDMDIVMTQDHHLVAYHDLALNPEFTRDKEGKWINPNKTRLIKDLTLKEVQGYDIGRAKPGTAYAKLFKDQMPVDGTYIPTLKEVIQYVKKTTGDKIHFQIEIKNDPRHPEKTFPLPVVDKALVALIQQEDIIGRTEVQAFDWHHLLALKKIDPTIQTAFLTQPAIIKAMHSTDPKIAGLWSAGYLLKNYSSLPAMIHDLGGNVWGPQDIELTKKDLAMAHKLGLKVVPWGWPDDPNGSGKLFDEPLIRKLINWGVDGIINDRPDKLCTLLKKNEAIKTS